MRWFRLVAGCLSVLGCSAPQRVAMPTAARPPECLAPAGEEPPATTPWTRRLIDPVSAPLTFESPLIHSSTTAVFLHHELPETSIFKGGHLTGAALQLRWAVTDRFAVIATKDGRFELHPGAGPDESGYADLAGGVKYALVDDPQAGRLITLGCTYEATQGDRDIFQGNGNGLWRPFVSAGLAGERVNTLLSLGASLPVSGDAESASWDYHAQWSPAGATEFVPLFELNGIHYQNNGRALAADFEGVDYANLGSNDVAGNDVITGALGCRWRVTSRADIGFAYERPLTERKDIFADRYTLDWVHRF